MTPPLTPVPNDLASRLERPVGRRAALLATLLIVPPVTVWLLAPRLGITGGTRGLAAASFVAVLLIGYQLWWLRMLVFATDAFGRRLHRGVRHFFRQRAMPQESTGFRPTPGELQQLGLRILEATRIFRTVARVTGLLVGIIAGFTVGWGAAAAVLIAQISWGQLLASLGHHGWLPIPEPE